MWSVEDGYTVWSELGTDSFVSEHQHPNNSKTYHLTPYIMHQLYQKSIKSNISIRLWLHLSNLRRVYLRVSAHSITKLMYTYWDLAVLCTLESSMHLFIVSRKGLWCH